MPQTWDIDAITPVQRELLGTHLRHARDGLMFFNRDTEARLITAGRQLAKLGIVEIDEPRSEDDCNEVCIELTDDGRAWLASLPPHTFTD